ncbi:relaxase NikB, partial [Salmonella enterica subsp. enterica serovar Kentucky]|nr:relaxase NikB [Salmonella enterica subsp. enterica serovar Kentucky]
GKWYPPSYRQWVEIQAAQGDRAAVSQLRGWDYRDRRKDKSRTTTTDRCVVLCEPGGTPVYGNTGDLEARLQKNGSVRFRDRRTGELVCTDYGDRVVFRNHHDRNALADKLDLIAPVLFKRDPRMGFEPEGNDGQFNQVFAEMVAWYNVTGFSEHGNYVITRPDVDQHREVSERGYRNYMDSNTYRDGAQPVQDSENRWEPPTPV